MPEPDTGESLGAHIERARRGARGFALILSANPMRDTGGGQRSAQLAIELLSRGFAVVFVSHGEVTETVDLGLSFSHDRLVEAALEPFLALFHGDGLDDALGSAEAFVLTQIPIEEWLLPVKRARREGAVTVYDSIDWWDSELGWGWYRRSAEKRMARSSDVLVATAPELVRHLEGLTRRDVSLLPNAFNAQIFRPERTYARPPDLPDSDLIAIYVGSLWLKSFDWELVRRASDAAPRTSFVFVGDYRNEGGPLPENCRFAGLKAQQDLPAYLAHADVAFIPWRVDEVTNATSPLKIYEFVSMGLPVVAPRLETLIGIPGVERVAAADFVGTLLRTSRRSVGAQLAAAMQAFSDGNSWAARVDVLLDRIERFRRR